MLALPGETQQQVLASSSKLDIHVHWLFIVSALKCSDFNVVSQVFNHPKRSAVFSNDFFDKTSFSCIRVVIKYCKFQPVPLEIESAHNAVWDSTVCIVCRMIK